MANLVIYTLTAPQAMKTLGVQADLVLKFHSRRLYLKLSECYTLKRVIKL